MLKGKSHEEISIILLAIMMTIVIIHMITNSDIVKWIGVFYGIGYMVYALENLIKTFKKSEDYFE